MSRLRAITEVFGRPDVWTIKPVTYGEMDPVVEMKALEEEVRKAEVYRKEIEL